MKQIFSILLSFILVASHMYLSIGTHYCGGDAVKSKILMGKAHIDCGMDGMDESSNHSETAEEYGEHLKKTPCCENVYQIIEPTDEFVKVAHQAYLNVDFAIVYLFASLTFDAYPKSTENLYADNSPPLYEKDIQILFQTFLI